MPFPGYVAPKGFGVDAGVLYVGTSPVGMGATEGGLTFDPGKEIGHPTFDGMTSEIAGLHRVLDYSANKISGDMLDLSGTAIGRYEPGSASDGSTGTNTITPIDATVFLAQGNYLRGVTYIGRRSDGKTIQVYMDWALIKKYTVKSAPKKEMLVSIEITAVLAPTETNLNKCPYVWREVD
jgi:hypothetical protein